jgi:hypothetical protein
LDQLTECRASYPLEFPHRIPAKDRFRVSVTK